MVRVAAIYTNPDIDLFIPIDKRERVLSFIENRVFKERWHFFNMAALPNGALIVRFS